MTILKTFPPKQFKQLQSASQEIGQMQWKDFRLRFTPTLIVEFTSWKIQTVITAKQEKNQIESKLNADQLNRKKQNLWRKKLEFDKVNSKSSSGSGHDWKRQDNSKISSLIYPSCAVPVAPFKNNIFLEFNIKTVVWLLWAPTSQQPVGPVALDVGGYRRRQPVKSRSDVWVGLLVGRLLLLVVVMVLVEVGGWVGGGDEDCRANARRNDVTELRVFHASNRIWPR